MKKFEFGSLFCTKCTATEAVREIKTALSGEALPSTKTLLCLNAHIYNLALRDPVLKRDLNAADYVLADGMSVVWGSWLFGGQLRSRCNMTELFRALMAEEDLPPLKVALIGCEKDQAERAASAIGKMNRGIEIVFCESGFLDDAAYDALLAEQQGLDLLLLGMGTPRSEAVAQRAKEASAARLIWHLGGGSFLIYSGDIQEAPPWMRKLGLQWLHRLLSDPKRMWKRYVFGNILFVWNILRERLLLRS